VTSPRLFLVKPIVRAWGFAYSGRAFVWIKTRTTGELHVGQGYTTRKNAEDVLLFRRGSPKRHAKDVHEVVLSPVRQHSQKPKEVRQRIERFCPGPYAELFARDTAPEWGSWGSEVGKFGRAAA
jgi:N6-adenosine-specific RNA methylase IME4